MTGGSNNATKADIGSVRTALHAMRDEVKAEIGAVGVLVERLDSRVTALLEGLSNVASKTDLHELDVRLSGRIAFLHDVVRSMADDVRKNTKETRQLRSDIAKLRLRFDRRDHRGLERRVTQIEKRVGIR